MITTQRALQGIGEAIELIHEMGEQISAATEQQTHVAEDISEQITRIAQASDHNAGFAAESAQLGGEMERTARAMYELVDRFRSKQPSA